MINKDDKRLWIVWETQRRNKELALAFNAELTKFDYSSRPSLIRYLLSLFKTIVQLIRKKPNLVFSPYPSLVLCLSLVLLKPVFRFSYVLDAHNVAVESFSKSGIVGVLTRWVLKKADFVIVTNDSLASKLEGIELEILPDKLPATSPSESAIEQVKQDHGEPITLIASFASDEPIEEFILGYNDWQEKNKPTLCITGKRSKAGDLLKYENEQIKFVDYLEEAEYEALISASSLLIDLTTREDCLVCGAYEALSVEVPILLSDTKQLRATFGEAAIYSQNHRKEFSSKLAEFFQNKQSYKNKITQEKQLFRADWQEKFEIVELKLKQFK